MIALSQSGRLLTINCRDEELMEKIEEYRKYFVTIQNNDREIKLSTKNGSMAMFSAFLLSYWLNQDNQLIKAEVILAETLEKEGVPSGEPSSKIGEHWCEKLPLVGDSVYYSFGSIMINGEKVFFGNSDKIYKNLIEVFLEDNNVLNFFNDNFLKIEPYNYGQYIEDFYKLSQNVDNYTNESAFESLIYQARKRNLKEQNKIKERRANQYYEKQRLENRRDLENARAMAAYLNFDADISDLPFYGRVEFNSKIEIFKFDYETDYSNLSVSSASGFKGFRPANYSVSIDKNAVTKRINQLAFYYQIPMNTRVKVITTSNLNEYTPTIIKNENETQYFLGRLRINYEDFTNFMKNSSSLNSVLDQFNAIEEKDILSETLSYNKAIGNKGINKI